jgi:hypothetical protein
MLHTPIYDVRGGRAYCGPTAIAAVTGEPISIIREVIRAQKGTKINGHAMPVIGISPTMLVNTMKVLGWEVVAHHDYTKTEHIYRLNDYLELVQMGTVKGPHIVWVTGHFYAVDDDEICDTYTKIPMDIHRFKRGRQRWVKRIWKFEKEGV